MENLIAVCTFNHICDDLVAILSDKVNSSMRMQYTLILSLYVGLDILYGSGNGHLLRWFWEIGPVATWLFPTVGGLGII